MQDLILRDSKGELVVTSLTIADVFERNHFDVLSSIDKVNKQLIDITNESQITFVKGKDKEGIRNTRTAYLNERQFLMVMPFVGGENPLTVKTGLLMNLCACVLQQKLLSNNAVNYCLMRPTHGLNYLMIRFTLQLCFCTMTLLRPMQKRRCIALISLIATFTAWF
jgi:hypothetical protein